MESTIFQEQVKGKSVLGHNKRVVVTKKFSEKKVLTTEKVTENDEVQKCTENITTIEEIDKYSDEVHKHTENITASEEVYKSYEKLQDMKEAVVTIRRKYPVKFEGQSKVYTRWFNLDHDFLRKVLYT